MSLKTLQEGSIFVADSHCAPWRSIFVDFLMAIERGEIKTPQLILMGDNFDLLFGPVLQTHRLNHEFIALLNRLSQKIEIIYLEGNHDFRLSSLFPNIEVVPLSHQPYMVEFNGEKIALLHGDIGVPLGYKIYTALIRNRVILGILNFINEHFNGVIINTLSEQMQRKNHCKKIDNFEVVAERLITEPWISSCDRVIEGHYHQNRSFGFKTYRYDNLGAFACNERYYVVKSSQNQSILDEVIFHKESQ